jgi:RNA polymerase sigma-70 factor (ECF subfamily)
MHEDAENRGDLDARLRQGDEQALAELFSSQRERLWRIVHFRLDDRLRGRIDPDDVLQEAYLAAVQRLGHYKEGTYTVPFLWLRAILKQTMIDLHRRHVGAQRRAADRDVALDASPFAQASATSMAITLIGKLTSPSQAAARAEMVATVEKAMATMDPIDQEVLALRHFEELNNNEVAQVLGIEQKAASIRYVRAVRRLKEILAAVSGLMEQPDG